MCGTTNKRYFVIFINGITDMKLATYTENSIRQLSMTSKMHSPRSYLFPLIKIYRKQHSSSMHTAIKMITFFL